MRVILLSIAIAGCGGSVSEDPRGVDATSAETSSDTRVIDSDTAVIDVAPDVWVTGEYQGMFRGSFETSAFYEGGACSWSKTAWWTESEDRTFYELTSTDGQYFVKFEGRLSPEGKYGHLGGYSRQITVTKVLSVTKLPPC